MLVAQSCLSLFDPTDCNASGSSIHGILQARILEWGAIPFSKEYFQPRNWTWTSGIAGKFFTIWAIKETLFVVGNNWLKDELLN